MLILGINGGGDLPNQETKLLDINSIPHDSAAVLIDDGKVVAAIEEERFNRSRGSGKAPISSMKYCLKSYGVEIKDIDKIVYPTTELELDIATVNNRIINEGYKEKTAREWIGGMLFKTFGINILKDSICFVDHDKCHASSAYYQSGFDKSLILTLSGSAYDRTAPPFGSGGCIIDASADSFDILDNINITNSLGVYYLTISKLLGCYKYDEYKVMELARYGNPNKFNKIIKKTYTLLPDGKYLINLMYCEMFFNFITPRRRGESFTQEHKDLAASLQEALTTIVLHILEYYRRKTGNTKLCLSGGVANNYLMNGRILATGLFDEVFVSPTSYNAGNALGGALYVSKMLKPNIKFERLQHVYWGTSIGDNDRISNILSKWGNFISFHKDDNITAATAKLIADNNVVGWVQGKSEFGCSTLGNRSILANPKAKEIKYSISGMLKEDEGCVTISPSIMEEYVDQYFETSKSKTTFSFMNYTLETKKDFRDVFGDAVQADGCSRIHTVTRSINDKYWNLINEFRKLTNVPFVLNTPFKNGAEPVINSEEDAIVCFLTTGINYLIIGDYLISKRDILNSDYLDLMIMRPVNSELKKSVVYSKEGNTKSIYEIRYISEDIYNQKITEELFNILQASDGKRSVRDLFSENNIKNHQINEIWNEIMKLWSLRLIILKPFTA